MRKNICLTHEYIAVSGRHTYNEGGALLLSWPLSGFTAAFEGERAIIHFSGGASDIDVQPVYVSVTVDGRKQKFALSRADEKILLDDLGAGRHTLTFRRISEGNVSIAPASLEVFGDVCEILPPPKGSDLRMEFIGDSISCGYGVLGSADGKEYNTFEEDAELTYASLCAKALGADIRVTAKGGHGIVADYTGLPTYLIPEFFEWKHTGGKDKHDFSSWIPQVVVINAGTNDSIGNVDEQTFIEGAMRFAARVREVYPDAVIFWAYGMMESKYESVLSAHIADMGADGEKIYFVPLPYTGVDGKGFAAHPNVVANERAAQVLIKAVRDVLHI